MSTEKFERLPADLFDNDATQRQPFNSDSSILGIM